MKHAIKIKQKRNKNAPYSILHAPCRKGFSLLEMIIAVFIFSLVVTVAVSAFVSAVSVRKKTKEIQQNMENARVAIDGMAKALRNGDIITGTVNTILAYNYSQERCEQYLFSGNNLTYSFKSVLQADYMADKTLCNSSLGGTFNMLSGTVSSGKFNVIPSVAGSSVGRVTILMQIQNAGGADKALMQTTVSLRSLSQEVNPT